MHLSEEINAKKVYAEYMTEIIFKRMKKIYSLIIIILLFLSLPGKLVHAELSDCSASIEDRSPISQNTRKSLTFHVTNGDSSEAHYLKIAVPNSNFTIEGYSIENWSALRNSGDIVFSGGTLGGGDSIDIVIETQTGSSDQSSSDWSVQMSDESVNPVLTQCSGDLGISISGSAPDTQPPDISDIVVSDVTSSSVKINWTTNESGDSVIDYGLADDYGLTKNDTALTTSHSLTLSSLTANSTYHYNIKSSDSAGNTNESGDNVFVTAKEGSTGTTQTGTSTNTTTTVTLTRVVTPTPTPTPTPDLTPPVITVATKFTAAFKTAPELSGSATDVSGVAKFAYSLDGGKNWIPVDNLKNAGAKSASFTFNPGTLVDDTYDVRIEAWDTKGNAGIFKAGKMVIDRLPPVIGPAIFSAGPIEIIPDEQGLIAITENMKTKVTLSMVGGPAEVNIHLLDESGQTLPFNPIPLSKDAGSGLWFGEIIFPGAGIYNLKVKAIDGATNQTEKTIQKVRVVNSGLITYADTELNAVSNVNITVYYSEPVTGRRIMWDGKPYGQENPLPVNPDGRYSLFLPAGKYYLRINSPGYKTFTSQMFELVKPEILSARIVLSRLDTYRIGNFSFSLPDIFPAQTALNFSSDSAQTGVKIDELQGKMVPAFELTDFSGRTVTDLDLRGKKSVITFLNSWQPQAVSQINALEKFSRDNPDTNALIIMTEESVPAAALYMKRAGTGIRIVADPDGTLIDPFKLVFIPTQVFINPQGLVTGSVSHQLSDSEFAAYFFK
jgi:hypothetical protein